MELNNTDESILEELDQERCTPRYLAEELSRSRAYINQRLTHLRDEEYVERVSRGLYRRAESAESKTATPEQIEICGVDVGSMASEIDRVESEETSKRLEEILREIFFHIAKEKEITRDELEEKIPNINERLPVDSFHSYWRYQLKQGERLTEHPNIEEKEGELRTLIYTEDSVTILI